MNATEMEVLISFLISQGYGRPRAEELVKQDPGAVQRQKQRYEQQSLPSIGSADGSPRGRRQNLYSQQEIDEAITTVRKKTWVLHQTAMRALGISPSTYFRRLKEGKLKRYSARTGCVYSAHVIEMLDGKVRKQ